MTLYDLLNLYAKVLKPDKAYNSTLLNENDRCASQAKYLYGYSLCCLIRELINNESDYLLLECSLREYRDKIPFFYDIVPLLYKRYLTLHPCTAGFNNFSEYIMKNYPKGLYTDEIQALDKLVKQEQYDDALIIINSIVRN